MFEEKIRKIAKEEIKYALDNIDIKSMVDKSSKNIICELFRENTDKEIINIIWANLYEVNTIVGMLKDGIAERVIKDISSKNEKTINDKVNSNDFIDLFVKKINDKQLLK